MVRYIVSEVDTTTGRTGSSFVLSSSKVDQNRENLRLDKISVGESRTQTFKRGNGPWWSSSGYYRTYLYTVSLYLQSLFLPTGYPHTVSPDYTPYQIYDSLQAFASSIAGLLSSRAVLESLNVLGTPSNDSANDGTEPLLDSASAATAATLLSVVQSTMSNLTTILFASYAAPRISSDVKFYRFLADIVNDTAFILDLLAPTLPSSFNLLVGINTTFPILGYLPFSLSPRTFTLVSSSMLRAVCGVAGGSAKAVLSTHFARNNPDSVGDLNAKDGSQETVVNLMGMWIGGYVVSRVNSIVATWCWMFGLLIMHLWANWRAVRSVSLRNLNRERATLVLHSLVDVCDKDAKDSWDDISVDKIGRQESVLGIVNKVWAFWHARYGSKSTMSWMRWRIGVSASHFINIFASSLPLGRKSNLVIFEELIALYQHEEYLLWYDCERHLATIVLKTNSQSSDQVKAWYQALIMQKLLGSDAEATRSHQRDTTSMLKKSLLRTNASWPLCQEQLMRVGWDLSASNLEQGSCIRVELKRDE